MRRVFSHRLIKPELLDHAEPGEARLNLTDLVKINRNFGGLTVMRKMLADVAPQDVPFTLLDVGAASGDTARFIQALYPCALVTSLDRNAVNMETAPQPKVLGDAFQLPFSENSFDFVCCSLLLHHFPDEQVVALLSGFYRCARRALLVSDLERHVIPYWFLPATKFVYGWRRITLHDGPISVRAAFRACELRELAERAGIEDARIEVHRPAFRISLVARKAGVAKAL